MRADIVHSDYIVCTFGYPRSQNQVSERCIIPLQSATSLIGIQ